MPLPDQSSPNASDPPASSRRERKKRETRLRIFRAASELFLEQGFEATTVDQIAARADVGKGTVFNYFPRKTSILAAIADDWMHQLIEHFGPIATWRGTTRKKLERLFGYVADLAIENPELSRLALAESMRRMSGVAPVTDHLYEKPVRELLEVTRGLLREGQEVGEIRADVDVEYAAAMLESAHFRSLAHWLRDGGPESRLRAEIAGKLDIIFNGLSP